MRSYAVIYERDEKGWGAYIPDLPGCIAVGKSREQCEERIRDAARMHLSAMKEDGEALPEPSSFAGMLDVEGP